MKINEIVENDEEHKKTLDRTGFWGEAGAGSIIFSEDTGRFLLQLRSASVEQPKTWGLWGGAIDSEDTPKETVIKELKEETGFTGNIKNIIPIYVFEHPKSGFKYYNFITVVENEFTPTLNWEGKSFKWCEYGNWPTPLHFGVNAILNDPKSVSVMKSLVTPRTQ